MKIKEYMELEKQQEAGQTEQTITNYFNLHKEKIVNKDSNKFLGSKI